MRILFLSPIGNIGGAERVLLTAVAGIRRDRPDAIVRVLSLGDGPLRDAVQALGCEFEALAIPRSVERLGDSQSRGGRATAAARLVPALAGLPRLAFRARSAIRRFAPDLVHSNGIKTHLLGRYAVPQAIPVVWHVHDFYGLRPSAAGLLRRASGRTRAAIAISNAVATDVARELPGVPGVTVPNAIDLNRFAPGLEVPDLLETRAGVAPAPTGTVRVGLVATYALWKGHLTFLDAAAQLARDLPELPVRWSIVGGPIYRTAAQHAEADLRAAAVARGIGDRVAFVGFAPDIERVYRSLDIVVHASDQPEPFGLTVAEAMACGRAVVVSAAGGAAELFTEGVDALGFAPGNVVQLAEAVRRLAIDSELRTRIGVAARRTAEERFDESRYGKQLLAVYDAVWSKGRVTPAVTE